MKTHKLYKAKKVTRYIAYLLLTYYFSFSASNCLAQNGGAAINPTGAAADNSAMLDVAADTSSSSSSQGLLIPRMGTTRRPESPAKGLMIYNTDCNSFQYYNGTSWISFYSTNNFVPATGDISGVTTFCSGLTGVAYSVSPITGVTSYNWTVPSGASISSGQGTSSITVDFGSTSGNICVTASTSCGTSSATCLLVTNINVPDAAGTISGTSTVCQGQNNVSYSVPAIANATNYTWTLPYGAYISSCSNTNSITVSFLPYASSGDITVYGTNQACTGAISAAFPITVSTTLAAAGTITGPSTVCVGDYYATYTVPEIADATGYTWTVPQYASITSTPTPNSITVYFPYSYSSGNITVYGTNALCSGGVSPVFPVSVELLPAAAGAITGSSSVCAGDYYVSYTVAPIANATSYIWTLPTNAYITGGSNTNSITVYFPGGSSSGYISVYGTNSVCSGGVSTALYVSVNTAASFSYSGSPYCNTGTASVSLNGDGIGGTFSADGQGPIYVSSNGDVDLSSSQPGGYTVTNTVNTGCPQSSTTAYITITALPVATFSYTGTPYCSNVGTAYPTFDGGGVAGTFTCTDPALILTPSNGYIDLASSPPGGYWVTNTIAATSGCAEVSASAYITITTLPIATFSYTGTPYCGYGTTSPTLDGGSTAGTFSSTSPYIYYDGSVSLNLVTPGDYTVYNTIPTSGGCPEVTATSSITITALPVATFSYTATPYCSDAGTASPTLDGGSTAGTFSSTSGLIIDASGNVNLSASTPGTYTVTNTIAAAGGCPEVTATSSISITALPVATFSYTATPYCSNVGGTSPTFDGGGVAGSFSSSGGLNIDGSGNVYPSSSTPGGYTVYNTIAASGGCAAVEASNSITITALPVATFSYSATPYCSDAGTASPTIEGVAGTFSSSGGLSIDGSGNVNLSASTPGGYTVYNTIAAAGGCEAVEATSSITITALPIATFSYSGTPYSSTSGTVYPTLDGVAGTFSITGGLTIDASGGVDTASTPGDYTVTNTIAAASGCAEVTATSPISITP
ncbi:MAG: hypothetical protein HGB12_00975 [Bacteroidetes bacterium]|nr:hypothetical protein [Bacteroidota bacterium]